jgi:hypothetical protein
MISRSTSIFSIISDSRCSHVAAAKSDFFFSFSYVFVPSLSWQNDHL